MGKKGMIVILSLLFGLIQVQAGEKDRYLGIHTGVMYPRIFNITASYELETAYHNAWEAYVDYATQWDECPDCEKVCMDSFWKERYSYAFGLAYKPAFKRGKNSVGRFRMGVDLGSCNRDFALGVELGFEYAMTLKNRVQLVLQQKNEVTFWGKPTFKNGLLVGIRFPL